MLGFYPLQNSSMPRGQWNFCHRRNLSSQIVRIAVSSEGGKGDVEQSELKATSPNSSQRQ